MADHVDVDHDRGVTFSAEEGEVETDSSSDDDDKMHLLVALNDGVHEETHYLPTVSIRRAFNNSDRHMTQPVVQAIHSAPTNPYIGRAKQPVARPRLYDKSWNRNHPGVVPVPPYDVNQNSPLQALIHCLSCAEV